MRRISSLTGMATIILLLGLLSMSYICCCLAFSTQQHPVSRSVRIAFHPNPFSPTMTAAATLPSLSLPRMTRATIALNLNNPGSIVGASNQVLAFLKQENTIHAFSVALGFGILCGYHFNLYLQERQKKSTWRSVQTETRERWSRYVRETEGWLYAIQTLRNAITAMTFLSTTVLTLLTVITGRLWEVIQRSPKNSVLFAQFALTAGLMLSSAYQFLQSARLMTHAGFMFPVERKGKTKVDRVMRKSQHAQWLGLRFLYSSFVPSSWIVGGPFVFLVTSVLMGLFFRKIDKVPAGLDSDPIYEYEI